MKKRFLALMIMLLTVIGIVGCQTSAISAPIEVTTVIINSNSSVNGVFIEDFSQSYYVLDDLSKMVNQEVTEYNTAKGSTALTIKECSVTGNSARVAIDYSSIEDYQTFQNTVAFSGTVAEALNQGYDLDVTVTSASDGALIVLNDAQTQLADKHIVILEDAPRVRVYKEILYTSADVKLINSYEADASENAEMTYIVFK